MFPYSSWGNAIFLTVANKNLPYILHFIWRVNSKDLLLLLFFVCQANAIFFPLYHRITCRRLLLNLLLFPNHNKNLSDLKNARDSSVKYKDATAQDMPCFSSPYHRMETFQPLFISSTGSFAAKQFHRFFLILLSLTLFTSTRRAPSFQPTSQFICLS